MISKNEVEHIAKLARLELTDAEITKMQKDMSAILDYFNLLKKIHGSSETAGILAEDLSAQRKDEAKPENTQMTEELVRAAPDKKENYIKVKSVL